MKRFYTKIAFFLIPLFVVWAVVEIFYRSVETNYSYKAEILKENRKDTEVLILGSSHAFYGINPEYFEAKTLNMANISQSIYFDELIFDQNIENLTNLKSVVLTISYFSLSQEDNTSEDAWRKYFYQQQMKLDVPIVSPFDIRKYSLALVRRFKSSADLIKEYFEKGTVVSSFQNGYGMQDETDIVPNKDAIAEQIAKKHEDGLMDFSLNIRKLNRIILMCKKNNINVYLVEMPVYKKYYENLRFNKEQKIIKTCQKLAASNENVIYVKLSRSPEFTNDDLRDADHLTNEGATKASKILNKIIEEKK